jgi:hypothetical protein
MKNKTIVDDIFDRSAARNRAASMGEAVPEVAPHVSPKPNGDEPAILLAAAGIMEQRGIHVTARKLIDMAHDIEAELELTAKP